MNKESYTKTERVRFSEIAEKYHSSKYVFIKNAHQHNLKNIDLLVPKNKLVVITGPSGSGKSSLAMDTLYAEGRRKYAESLSAYIRQFLGKIEKPRVDYIHGLAPAIALEQKTVNNNPRSTVGSVTEIYDYLKLLFLRIGKIYHPETGQEIKKHSVRDVLNYVGNLKPGTRFMILSPVHAIIAKYPEKWKEFLTAQGLNRIWFKGKILNIEQDDISVNGNEKDIFAVIDRLIVPSADSEKEEFDSRLEDSITSAFKESEGQCAVQAEGNLMLFSKKPETEGFTLVEPDIHFFSYNHPHGACKRCEGFGHILGIDPQKVIPDTSLSVYDNAIACWKGDVFQWYKNQLIKNAWRFDFPVHTPVRELTKEQYKLLWDGNRYFTGITGFFEELGREMYKIQNRVFIARYRGRTECPECEGTRVSKETDIVRVGGRHLRSLLKEEISDLLSFFRSLNLSESEKKIVNVVWKEIVSRLEFMEKAGLGYLTLSRGMNTLSGGESQRVNLVTQLGSSLCGSMYILDEPSIGLHPKDTENLIEILKKLRDQGNSVWVIEHDEQMIRSADWLIDMGPGAGIHGGQVLYNGPAEEIFSSDSTSDTLAYLTGKQKNFPLYPKPRISQHRLMLHPSGRHNLKISKVEIPLHVLCVICGVSGSGKSTLIKEELVPELEYYLNSGKIGEGKKLQGDYKQIDFMEFIDQNPLGRSSRSNPVTYLKVFDDIRKLYSEQSDGRYSSGFFSLNVPGGRCEYCKGEGTLTIEMQFMADVEIPCEECLGHRYTEEALQVKYQGLNISELLNLSVEELYELFSKDKSNLAKKICRGLQPLLDVGLGYLKAGQSTSTLSGGEAQRLKLASYLTPQSSDKKGIFIFDEPTTGLHFSDVRRLLECFNALISKGHSVLVIEHHPDLIRNADWIIELGPGGGKSGGQVIFSGTLEQMKTDANSITKNYL
jgi:excinuclease ABC subunit A